MILSSVAPFGYRRRFCCTAAYTLLLPICGFHSAVLRRGLGGLEGGMEKRRIMNDIDK